MSSVNASTMTEPTECHRVRIWADGCYDMAHFGHANSLRQAKAYGDYLIVGVHSDQEITKHKSAPPVFNEQERYEMIRAIKWVDDVVEAAPYVTTLKTLDRYGADFCAHGDDITTTANGSDTYAEVKGAGRYKEVKRTQGVSTTDLVNRILYKGQEDNIGDSNPVKSSPYTGSTQLFWTTEKIAQFAFDTTAPSPTSVVIYVPGAFDIFHPGHIALFKEIHKTYGPQTHLVVGVYDDATVSLVHGSSKFPLMSLAERVQTLLGCRYVANVIIGAPLTVNAELLEHFQVTAVVVGKGNDGLGLEVAKQRGLFQVISSGSETTTLGIVERVLSQRELYTKRNKDKQRKEMELLERMQEE